MATQLRTTRPVGGVLVSYGRIRRGPMAGDAFTQIRNSVFRDSRLTAKAMGIFGNISTHRDGWGITPDSLSTQMRDGIAAIKSGLRELEEYGYLRRTRVRNSDGTLGASVYFITDQPEMFLGDSELENRRSEPEVENPPVVQPPVVDRLHKKTTSKKISNKKTLSPRAVPSAASEPPASPEERENPAAPNNDTDPATAVAAAWTATRGCRRNPAAERDITASALQLLAAAWPLPDVIALAEDMARRQPTYRDLTRHADHWQPARPTQPAAARPNLPSWCEKCADDDPAARFNPRLRQLNGAPCPNCHPDTTVAA